MSVTAPPLGGRIVIAQRWSDATFLHWRVDPARVAPLLPEGTRPDEIDGSTWVGLIAFRLSHSAFLGGPAVPYFGTFPEVNVRLYSVDERGRRGVVFASLDASRLVSVLTARAAFGLPYHWARMSMGRRGGLVAYRSRRHDLDARLVPKRNERAVPNAGTHLVARPLSAPVEGDPIADFLTARWAFHETHLGVTNYARNEHERWPLRKAELIRMDDQLLAAAGFPDLGAATPDSVLFSPGVRTVFGLPRQLPGS
ncbi:hypothetical protein DDQ50_12460 [Amnibacterium flavum]|uniref:DUF2071 domain-containing protein n=1 Tax=Amnibacterium flavum TaxID=2173173 RepID=A0A2V1HQN1_9MICO|nr:hypothetical protein DDQ50_12460 [Amnibacterium flavum]